MAYTDRCLLVHGHFYQPPRENPWTGEIDPQYSAAPWENWNKRIADECYIPMARSRVYNTHGRITDLYNNYAHTNFNFGPTLLSWLAVNHPDLLHHLCDAVAMDRTFAMAQAYNHMMLPLADARDRHTQIVWGLREFHHRFGFYPDGMWLPECGIDPETTRALIDHAVKYIILSPHQASTARPFGQAEWRDVSMGAIDTRRAYRLFDTDGGGRTHFDRYLDVIFYTPGLNLKVSFDHILNRPEDLARELDQCYRPDFPGAQLVSIVTDGEIYGHHEKNGETTLSRLFTGIAPSMELAVVSAGKFIRDNPPAWEVKLWNGDDDSGSSWSCQHGMGRWFRDCGCTPPAPAGWNQAWRGPLRDAFDAIRDRVKATARRVLGGLLWDMDEAREDYIRVILQPVPAVRRAFIERHVRRPPTLDEVKAVWELLESLHNAMLMYASCGWFFDEISGLEPVQNMRYALRAAELAQPYHGDEDLAALLETRLALAKSNITGYGDGGQVFRSLALPAKHSNRELAAAMAICLAADFPLDHLSWTVVDRTEAVQYSDSNGNQISWGSFVAHDVRLDVFIRATWLARLDDFDCSGVVFKDFDVVQGDPMREADSCPLAPSEEFGWLREVKASTEKLSRQELMEAFQKNGVGNDRLPEAVRGMLYRKFSGIKEADLLSESAHLGTRAVPFLSRARLHGARVPDAIVKTVSTAFEQDIIQAVLNAIASGTYDGSAVEPVKRLIAAARELGIEPGLGGAAQALYTAAVEMFHWLHHLPDPAWLESWIPRRLPDGTYWLAPQARLNRGLAYPAASNVALALGKGLAVIRSALMASDDPVAAALVRMPIRETISFSRTIGLEPSDWHTLGIMFWEGLDKTLPWLIADDPAGYMAGEVGDRVRLVGELLGFAPETVEKRILVATREGMRKA